MRSPAAMPRERREARGAEATSSLVRLRERRREEGEGDEEGIARAMASLSCWSEESPEMSILRVSLESKGRTLSFMVDLVESRGRRRRRNGEWWAGDTNREWRGEY